MVTTKDRITNEAGTVCPACKRDDWHVRGSIKCEQLELALLRERAQELEDVAYLDRAGSLLGTRLDIPAELPGIDEDHIHFVLMPIGAVSRRAAVVWLKSEGALCSHGNNPRDCRGNH
jgi:hypothetical protein